MSNAKIALIVAALAMVGSAPAAAEVYVHRGEHGEVSFTDQALPGAERVELEPTVPPPDAPEELEQRIRQTLEVAEALEQSRLAREKARAEARAAARAASQPEPAPQVIYQDRYVARPYLFGARFDDRFRGRHDFRDHHDFRDRDDFRDRKRWDERRHDRHRGERPIEKRFPYEPD